MRVVLQSMALKQGDGIPLPPEFFLFRLSQFIWIREGMTPEAIGHAF